MKKASSIFLEALILLLVISLSACTNSTGFSIMDILAKGPYDTSLITGIPCEAPCWQSLVTGVSGQEKVFTVIENLSFVNPDSIIVLPINRYKLGTTDLQEGISIDVKCFDSSTTKCASFKLYEEILFHISVLTGNSYSFGDAVNKFGEPDYLSPISFGERVDCQIELTWVNERITLVHIIDDYESAIEWCDGITAGNKLDSSFEVQIVRYFSPEWSNFLPREGKDYSWPGFED